MSLTVKTITYNLNEGVAERDFLAASRAATADLETVDGFIERRLLMGSDGRWSDSVVWQSRRHADASEDVIASMSGCATCIAFMDHQTLDVRHEDVVQTSKLISH